jgi:hypothetical protein
MLHQIARRGRLLSTMMTAPGSYSVIGRLLEGTSESAAASVPPKARMVRLALDIYDDLLSCLRRTNDPNVRHYREVPHPPGASVASPWVLPETYLDSKDLARRTFTTHTAHAGNSAIMFRTAAGVIRCGFIEDIWSHNHQKHDTHYLVVRPHEGLSPQDSRENPYSGRPKLHTHLFYSRKSNEAAHLIKLADIIAHTAYIVCSPGTYGIKQGTLLAVNLDRGRSNIVY